MDGFGSLWASLYGRIRKEEWRMSSLKMPVNKMKEKRDMNRMELVFYLA